MCEIPGRTVKVIRISSTLAVQEVAYRHEDAVHYFECLRIIILGFEPTLRLEDSCVTSPYALVIVCCPDRREIEMSAAFYAPEWDEFVFRLLTKCERLLLFLPERTCLRFRLLQAEQL